MNIKLFSLLIIFSGGLLSCLNEKSNSAASPENSWKMLARNAGKIGKPQWQPMLHYVADLHRRSTHPANYPFNYEWEEIGPGYIYGPAFGHWDIVHQSIDVMDFLPEHALHQLLNDINNQEPSGMVPGVIWMPGQPSGRDSVHWSKKEEGHPPFWVVAVQDYIKTTGDKTHLADFFTALVRQLSWFENSRKQKKICHANIIWGIIH